MFVAFLPWGNKLDFGERRLARGGADRPFSNGDTYRAFSIGGAATRRLDRVGARGGGRLSRRSTRLRLRRCDGNRSDILGPFPARRVAPISIVAVPPSSSFAPSRLRAKRYR
jgi:hypothetical protein